MNDFLDNDLGVSDDELKFFGYLMTCELRIYKNAELDRAKKWISEK